MRDHGGNLDAAMAAFGGASEDWVDLSTGINPGPYPLPEIPARAWEVLPTAADLKALEQAAQRAYRTDAKVLPLAGASAAIQLVPQLRKPGQARVLGPTYNEHAAALSAAGWQVDTVADIAGLRGADLAVVVNPNNPDGRRSEPEALMSLAASVDFLVVDESFADGWPELSLAPHLDASTEGIMVMRSFGKFFGLAGLRLGFAIGGKEIGRMGELAGPWPVSGPAIAVGAKALNDAVWKEASFARLSEDARRLDTLANVAGWNVVGGTELFRLYDAGNAQLAQNMLAGGKVWSRIFPYSKGWIRLGLPDGEKDWAQVETAFATF